jgi:hypothetical protein
VPAASPLSAIPASPNDTPDVAPGRAAASAGGLTSRIDAIGRRVPDEFVEDAARCGRVVFRRFGRRVE